MALKIMKEDTTKLKRDMLMETSTSHLLMDNERFMLNYQSMEKKQNKPKRRQGKLNKRRTRQRML